MGTAKKAGYADVLVGLQYGDEGKARVVDHLAGEYEVIARFNGGANAGHTIATPDGTLRLRQVPSGVLHPGVALYIGSGCVIGLQQLAAEIEMLAAQGIDLGGRLTISDRCPVVQPLHVLADRHDGAQIGTTGNGIGPCYADLATRVRGGERSSFQLRDLVVDGSRVFEQMMRLAVQRDGDGEGLVAVVNAMRQAWKVVEPFVTDDPVALLRRVEAGANVLFEGAQSVMLDVVQGVQPWVTSSHTMPSYAYVGGDLPCKYHRKTIGVAKAIVSRVGSGPLPTELGAGRSEAYCADAAREGRGGADEAARLDPLALLAEADEFSIGVAIRMLSNEYGTGTGRPRRVGLLDVAQLRLAVRQCGVDEVYLNKCDSLAAFDRTRERCIPVVAGATDTGGQRVVRFPAFAEDTIPRDATSPLPPQLEALLEWLADAIGRPLRGIGLGPGRAQMRHFQNHQQTRP
ncbi:Adenylosuccinate synthetase [Cupriavidus necator]|uniref:Adenylosuccinate synthetase n=1 Tax=Cupriavidus necator (strain ATCC 17699 / DSM 428 / KCTC 22496 / NCIMB 10442 / H16 / Stanier 337) TaxID=381666 RepID=Q0JZP8_CUPNH|nr:MULTISPECIES: adenylosuccinate synthetase [Cupriavidus]EON18007.1 adenylosuccinate synthetase [Cupriavidus sp. GA3-3]QCC04590.1 adenylosuccinate synthetase [Cupriavidus necator H16]QQB79284.1 adenylosuccinate synthetase [Cupriavidus necator]WKA43509.1 adenylosuccinate synthetase [Cupriavidus necator]CAJ96776.1 adenylosuccinate synthetase [Cupriavidus necator H16]